MILNNIIILHLFLKLRLIICLVRLDNSQWLTCVKTSERGVKNHLSLSVKKTLRISPYGLSHTGKVCICGCICIEFVHCLFKCWKSVWYWVCCVCQVKYIYIALFTIQIVSKLLHSINQNNLTVFIYYWKKDIQVW